MLFWVQWISRVRSYTGGNYSGIITIAPVHARVEELQGIVILSSVLTALALVLLIWSLGYEKRNSDNIVSSVTATE